MRSRSRAELFPSFLNYSREKERERDSGRRCCAYTSFIIYYARSIRECLTVIIARRINDVIPALIDQLARSNGLLFDRPCVVCAIVEQCIEGWLIGRYVTFEIKTHIPDVFVAGILLNVALSLYYNILKIILDKVIIFLILLLSSLGGVVFYMLH